MMRTDAWYMMEELIRRAKQSASESLQTFCQSRNIQLRGRPLIRSSCGFTYIFDLVSRERSLSLEDLRRGSVDFGVIQVIVPIDSSLVGGIYRIALVDGVVTLFDVEGRKRGRTGHWSFTLEPPGPHDVFDCNTTSGPTNQGFKQIKLCCRIFLESQVATYEGTHCVWFPVPSLFDDDTGDHLTLAAPTVAEPTGAAPVRFAMRRLSIKNEVKTLTKADGTKLTHSARKDLRPALEGKILMPGKNLFYTDDRTGTQLWIDYDGKTAIEYGASDPQGQRIPVQVSSGEDEAGVAICHLCTGGVPIDSIGDCHVILCDPIFRIPL